MLVKGTVKQKESHTFDIYSAVYYNTEFHHFIRRFI